jgi:hypothetical protein
MNKNIDRTSDRNNRSGPEKPVVQDSTDALPSALTFFVTTKQRRTIINLLSSIDKNRSSAIIVALGLDAQN